MENKKFICTVIILAVSIIAGSIIISNALNNFSASISSMDSANSPKEAQSLMTFEETANYLKLKPNELEYLIEWSGHEMPYLKINGNYIFTKNGIDKWLETTQIELDI